MTILDLLLRPLRSARVTRPYPGLTDVPDRGRRGTPVLNAEACVASADCVRACPTAAISVLDGQEGKTWQIDYGSCIFCGRCLDVCPTSAIASSSDFELAQRRREDVVATYRLRQR